MFTDISYLILLVISSLKILLCLLQGIAFISSKFNVGGIPWPTAKVLRRSKITIKITLLELQNYNCAQKKSRVYEIYSEFVAVHYLRIKVAE
jgi:hypothetical protein